MDENDSSLDIEFKRYLQILRPYLAQLLDQDVIGVCKAWIQKLSNCSDKEKVLRNRYVFGLCHQLAKGLLDEPFLTCPTDKDLKPLPEDFDSDTSFSELEYVAVNSGDSAKLLYRNNRMPTSETNYLSHETDQQTKTNNVDCHDDQFNNTDQNIQQNFETQLFCYNCPKIIDHHEYRGRANNLIMKLREIKTQNIILQRELEALRRDCKMKHTDKVEQTDKVQASTSFESHDSIFSVSKVKNIIHELQESKNSLVHTVVKLKEKLNRFEEIKNHEIEEIKANHRLEILKIKSTARDETKIIYENELKELQVQYELKIANFQSELLSEKENCVQSKVEQINQKDMIIKSKDVEIELLKSSLENQKKQWHDIISKFLEKPKEFVINEDIKNKSEQLEKRLNKMEKSKAKCIRVYEAKLAHLQREKDLVECSLQLQLVRQRAQVVNEVTDETQTELNTALNKLENKYKEIVANVQATALQRRAQDQVALESILNAASGVRNDGLTHCLQGLNRSQFNSKTIQNQNRNRNRSYDSDLSALMQGNKVGNLFGADKSFGEDSVMTGYCLAGERMGELFEKVYIPQRDIGEGPPKK